MNVQALDLESHFLLFISHPKRNQNRITIENLAPDFLAGTQ